MDSTGDGRYEASEAAEREVTKDVRYQEYREIALDL